MPKLITGVLLGLVLGLYLDSAGMREHGQLLSQIKTVLTNLFSGWA